MQNHDWTEVFPEFETSAVRFQKLCGYFASMVKQLDETKLPGLEIKAIGQNAADISYLGSNYKVKIELDVDTDDVNYLRLYKQKWPADEFVEVQNLKLDERARVNLPKVETRAIDTDPIRVLHFLLFGVDED